MVDWGTFDTYALLVLRRCRSKHLACVHVFPFLETHNQNKVACEEFSGQARKGYGGGHATAASNAARMFEARESAVDLAVGLEEKVC